MIDLGAVASMIGSLVVAVLGSSVVTACLQRRWSKKDKNDAEVSAIRLSLLFNLQNFGEKIISRGYCTSLEYNQFCDAYKTYKALDGDGYADSLKEQIDEVNKNTIQGGMLI